MTDLQKIDNEFGRISGLTSQLTASTNDLVDLIGKAFNADIADKSQKALKRAIWGVHETLLRIEDSLDEARR